jgi:cadmium resistance protein CadD (predicted permease)
MATPIVPPGTALLSTGTCTSTGTRPGGPSVPDAPAAVYVAVFLVLVGVWCAAGWFFATRPGVAGVIGRWGHVLHPLVLITLGLFILGLFILVQGGAFGL